MRLLLIQSSQLTDGGGVYKAPKAIFPHQSLLALVSSTPPEFQVEIIDEYSETVAFDDPADIIGSSFMTPQTLRD